MGDIYWNIILSLIIIMLQRFYGYEGGSQRLIRAALQSEFRRKGFSGAFVVTFKNGKRVPVREALRLLN